MRTKGVGSGINREVLVWDLSDIHYFEFNMGCCLFQITYTFPFFLKIRSFHALHFFPYIYLGLRTNKIPLMYDKKPVSVGAT